MIPPLFCVWDKRLFALTIILPLKALELAGAMDDCLDDKKLRMRVLFHKRRSAIYRAEPGVTEANSEVAEAMNEWYRAMRNEVVILNTSAIYLYRAQVVVITSTNIIYSQNHLPNPNHPFFFVCSSTLDDAPSSSTPFTLPFPPSTGAAIAPPPRPG